MQDCDTVQKFGGVVFGEQKFLLSNCQYRMKLVIEIRENFVDEAVTMNKCDCAEVVAVRCFVVCCKAC